jgi:hypothetical protein
VPLSNFVLRGFGFIHHSIAILYHQVPNPNITIRHFCIAVRGQVRAYVEAAVSDASQLSRTHLFLDVATATNFYEHAAWPALCCHVRVLDFFGTPAAGTPPPPLKNPHAPTQMHARLTNQHGSHRQRRRNDAAELCSC